jgi:hypothetical protein
MLTLHHFLRGDHAFATLIRARASMRSLEPTPYYHTVAQAIAANPHRARFKRLSHLRSKAVVMPAWQMGQGPRHWGPRWLAGSWPTSASTWRMEIRSRMARQSDREFEEARYPRERNTHGVSSKGPWVMSSSLRSLDW